MAFPMAEPPLAGILSLAPTLFIFIISKESIDKILSLSRHLVLNTLKF